MVRGWLENEAQLGLTFHSLSDPPFNVKSKWILFRVVVTVVIDYTLNQRSEHNEDRKISESRVRSFISIVNVPLDESVSASPGEDTFPSALISIVK